MTSPSLDVPFLSYRDLRQKARIFLQTHHPKFNIPIPIEHIIEFKFRINIIPIPGLRDLYDIDGFTASDLQNIYVDRHVYLNKREMRYRFTLAHEMGHVVLHGKLFKQIEFSSIDEWKKFISDMPDAVQQTLEWQAYNFAGLILVPPAALAKEAKKALQRAQSVGFDLKRIPDITWKHVAEYVGRKFNVSAVVIEKRMAKDDLFKKLLAN